MSRNIVQLSSVSAIREPVAARFAVVAASGVRRLPAAILLSALLVGSTPVLAGSMSRVDEPSRTSESEPSFWEVLLASWITPDPMIGTPAGKDDGSEEDPETGSG